MKKNAKTKSMKEMMVDIDSMTNEYDWQNNQFSCFMCLSYDNASGTIGMKLMGSDVALTTVMAETMKSDHRLRDLLMQAFGTYFGNLMGQICASEQAQAEHEPPLNS